MSNINFKPWVGKDYLTKGYQGQRILVLGESHYCQKELVEVGRCHPICKKEIMNSECHSQTQDVIREAVYDYCGQPYLRCFVSFERAVAGKVLTQEERENFWESVPDKIIVWGVRLYNGLPDLGGRGSKLKITNADTADVWHYTIGGKEIPALKIHHPSCPTGKNWDYWHGVISKFLEQQLRGSRKPKQRVGKTNIHNNYGFKNV